MSNKINTKDFVKRLADSLKTEEVLSTVEWMEKNKFRTSQGDTFDFVRFPFLIQPLNDNSKEVIIQSSAQVGKTEGMFAKAIKETKEGTNVLFSQPTEELRNLLVKTKLNAIVNQNPFIKDITKGDLSVKTIGKNNLFLPYTFGSGIVGYSAEKNYYDEVSISNPDTIELLKGRQLSYDNPKAVYMSNPKVPFDLLNRKFLDSTQNHWAIRHDCNGKLQILNYDGMYGMNGNIDKENGTYVCQYCKNELLPHHIQEGQWVEKHPNREAKGYWMHQMMRVSNSVEQQRERARDLIKQEATSMDTFMRMYLGLPYSGSNVNFSPELFYPLCDADIVEQKGNKVMGLDIGGSEKESGGHHYVVMVDTTITDIGTFKTIDEAENYIVKEEVNFVISDYMPDYERVKTMQLKFPSIVWRAYFKNTRSDNDLKWDSEQGMVFIPKHTTFDSIANELKDKQFSFAYPKEHPKMKEFMRQFSTISKIPSFDSVGNPTYKWEAPKGADDHYPMSFVYAYIGRKRWDEIRLSHGIYQSEKYLKEANSWDDFESSYNEEKNWMDY